jgi:dienelactone hydrolase
MRPIAFAVALLSLTLIARGEVKTEIVDYKDGDVTLRGYLAYDDSIQGKRPGIVVIPEWWGLNDYIKGRAAQLAKLGYIAFAADIYGDGFVTDDPKVAGEKSGAAKQAGLLRPRGKLALEQLKKNERVDPQNVAAIGYCFGGSTVLEMARDGQELKGVVSFHGALKSDHPAQKGQVKPRVLVLHGAADPLVPPEEVAALEKEMKDAGADAKVVQYPGAKHAFTNPDADKYNLPPVAYNKSADEKSWREMQNFFAEIFGEANPKSAAGEPKRSE